MCVLHLCYYYVMIMCYITINNTPNLLGFDRLLPDDEYHEAIKIWKAHTLSLNLWRSSST
jgi:hypothetical protein